LTRPAVARKILLRSLLIGGEGEAVATVPQPPEGNSQSFRISFEREADGRWIAEVPDLPGVMAYGDTRADAERAVTALALRVIADDVSDETRRPPKSIRFTE
jgi:predicted RNase H-like HicB family nuclease